MAKWAALTRPWLGAQRGYSPPICVTFGKSVHLSLLPCPSLHSVHKTVFPFVVTAGDGVSDECRQYRPALAASGQASGQRTVALWSGSVSGFRAGACVRVHVSVFVSARACAHVGGIRFQSHVLWYCLCIHSLSHETAKPRARPSLLHPQDPKQARTRCARDDCVVNECARSTCTRRAKTPPVPTGSRPAVGSLHSSPSLCRAHQQKIHCPSSLTAKGPVLPASSQMCLGVGQGPLGKY